MKREKLQNSLKCFLQNIRNYNDILTFLFLFFVFFCTNSWNKNDTDLLIFVFHKDFFVFYTFIILLFKFVNKTFQFEIQWTIFKLEISIFLTPRSDVMEKGFSNNSRCRQTWANNYMILINAFVHTKWVGQNICLESQPYRVVLCSAFCNLWSLWIQYCRCWRVRTEAIIYCHRNIVGHVV